MGLSLKHEEILHQQRGLDPEILSVFGVETFAHNSGGDWIRFPFLVGDKVVNHKYRTISGEKRFFQDKDHKAAFWNFNCLADTTLQAEPLIICEGEFDALALIQAGYLRTVSVPDGAPGKPIGDTETTKYDFLLAALPLLKGVPEIILMTDDDQAGYALRDDLALRLGRPRCKWVQFPMHPDATRRLKDPNEVLMHYGKRGLTEVVNRAQFLKVKGIFRMSELPPLAIPEALDLGFPGLERHLKARLGDFWVVTGIPGHGKSTWLNDAICRLTDRYGMTACFASFEQQPQTDHRRSLRRWHGGRPEQYLTVDELKKADAWIDRHFSFLVPDEDDEADLKWVLDRAAASVIQHGAQIVVIDPWNEMDHARPREMSLTEYTGFAIKEFKRFAKTKNVLVIVVAHPTKLKKSDDNIVAMPTLYDISDSAHWVNKPEVGIIVHRPDLTQTETVVKIAKVRYQDQIGVPGQVSTVFDVARGRYTVRSLAQDDGA